MVWLWSVGPLIVLLTALWLAIGTHKMVKQRLGLAEDRRIALAESTAVLRARTSKLHHDIEQFGDGPEGDTNNGRADR